MTKRVISNKFIDLNDQEYQTYQKIIEGYDPKFHAETFFDGLFESDNNGMILFVQPPSKKQFTMECYMFLISVMHSQHLRQFRKVIDDEILFLNKKVNDAIEKISATKPT